MPVMPTISNDLSISSATCAKAASRSSRGKEIKPCLQALLHGALRRDVVLVLAVELIGPHEPPPQHQGSKALLGKATKVILTPKQAA